MNQKTVSALWWLVSLLPFGNSAHILPSSCFLVTISSLSQITCQFLEVGMYLVCEPFNTHHPGLRVVGCKLVLFLQVCWCVFMVTDHTRQSRVMNLINWRWGAYVCVCVCGFSYIFLRDISSLQEVLIHEWQYSSSRHKWKRNTGIKDLVCSPKSII